MFTADLCGMWWLYCIHKPRIHPFIYQFPFFIDFNFKWQRRRQQRLLLATTTENKQIESPRCLDTFPMQPDRLVNHFRLFFLTTTYIFRKEANKREIPEAKSRLEHIFGNENGERIRVNANTFYDTLHEKAIKVGEKKKFYPYDKQDRLCVAMKLQIVENGIQNIVYRYMVVYKCAHTRSSADSAGQCVASGREILFLDILNWFAAAHMAMKSALFLLLLSTFEIQKILFKW